MKIVKKIIIVLLILFLLLMCLYLINISNELLIRSKEQTTQVNHLQQEVSQLNSRIIALPKPKQKQDKVQVTYNIPKPSIKTTVIATLAYLGNFFKNISIFSLTSQ